MMPLPNIRRIQDARRSQRFPTNFPAELVVWHRRLPVTVSDISRLGAQLKGDSLPLVGQEVMLVARSLEVAATVAWRRDEVAGLNFHWDVEPLEIVRQNAAEMRLFRTMRTFGTRRS